MENGGQRNKVKTPSSPKTNKIMFWLWNKKGEKGKSKVLKWNHDNINELISYIDKIDAFILCYWYMWGGKMGVKFLFITVLLYFKSSLMCNCVTPYYTLCWSFNLTLFLHVILSVSMLICHYFYLSPLIYILQSVTALRIMEKKGK